MNELRQILINARARIADPEHFVQDAYATDNAGMECDVFAEDCYAYCAHGAIARETGAQLSNAGIAPDISLYGHAWRALDNAARGVFVESIGRTVTSIVDLNDGDEFNTAHRNVLAAFDRAIEAAKG